MDARGVQRALEKIQGLAESAEGIGVRNVETIQREPRLSASARQELLPLYREHALKMVLMYSELGAAICEILRKEAEDDTARGLVDLFHANFSAMRDRSLEKLRREIGAVERLR